MRAFVVPNFQKSETAAILENLVSLADRHGLELCSAPISEGSNTFLDLSPEQEQQLRCCDVIIAIGGDGTIMHCAKLGASFQKPIMGVNAGELGFLAQVEPHNLDQCLRRFMTGDYRVEYRSAIAATFSSELIRPLTFAINDIVITRAPQYNMARFITSCNHREIDSYRADGLIFSTSTGSTAYNLSAGGPVLDPLVNAITLVPICPHSLSVCPLVFSEDRVITVSSEETPLTVVADGAQRRSIPADTAIQITTATKKAGFITFCEQEFFEILTKKIKQRM